MVLPILVVIPMLVVLQMIAVPESAGTPNCLGGIVLLLLAMILMLHGFTLEAALDSAYGPLRNLSRLWLVS